MTHGLEPWQIRRSEFNHDWLGNKYLNSLRAFLSRIEDPDADVARLREFLEEDLPQWRERHGAAVGLVETFESEMSPKKLLSRPPLARLDEGTKEWLGLLVHGLWLARLPVKHWVADALAAIERVDSGHQGLCNDMNDIELTAQALGERAASFQAFQDALIAMSAAFSRFPQTIRVA